MRIGILADLYLPHISGITVFIFLYQKTLESFGHEAHVFTFGPPQAGDEAARVHRTPGLRIGKTGFFINPQHTPRNRELIRSMDLLHVTHPFLSGTLAFRYRRTPSTPVVFTSQTRYDLYIQHNFPAPVRPPARWLLRAFLPGFCRRCAMIIAPSASAITMLRALGVERKIEIIPNPVDLEAFHPQEKFRRERTRAVYIGRLAAEKNIAFLLRAFSIAVSQRPSLELSIVGDGPDQTALEALARGLGLDPHAIFLGERPHEDLPAVLSEYDLFLTASLTEVHPLSVIEAMAAGLPVVAVGGAGISETVQDGVSGLLSANSPADFAEKILRLAGDPALGRKLASGAARAAQAYDLRNVTRQHLEKFAALVPAEGSTHAIRE